MSAWTYRNVWRQGRSSDCSTSSSNPIMEDAMGGAEDIFHPSSLIYTDGAPHAEARRPEPIPDHPRTWRHAYRGHRDEPVELARCRYCAWGRAPAVEEARNRRERIAETAASMAGGSEESRTQDRAGRGTEFQRAETNWPKRLQGFKDAVAETKSR